MARLTEEAKIYVVTGLACYRQPWELIEGLKEEFDIDGVSHQQLLVYNPERSGRKKIAKKWVKLHDRTRENFLKEVEDVPIAHKAYRIRELQTIYDKYKRRKNYIAAQAVLEQAAKEMNNAYGPSNVSLIANQENNTFLTQVNALIASKSKE